MVGIPERKQEIFQDLDHLAPVETPLGTNTSSIPITRIAEATENPQRVLGLHFFGPLSILINNAGVSVGSLRFEEYQDNDIDFIIATNLIGAAKVARRAVRQMIENNIRGNIVNIASMLGIANMKGSSCYDASKWGLVGFTRSLMLDLAPHRIRVNALCPGVFPTEVWTDGALESEAGKRCIQRCPLQRVGSSMNWEAHYCSWYPLPVRTSTAPYYQWMEDTIYNPAKSE